MPRFLLNLESDIFLPGIDNSGFCGIYLFHCCLTLVKKLCFVVHIVLHVSVLMLLQLWLRLMFPKGLVFTWWDCPIVR